MIAPRRLRLLGLVAVLFLVVPMNSSCAFVNPHNRPVWNAFEANMVPEGDGAFWATLPLTVPVGLAAILVDTFIAHPIQVIDNAWDDTVDVWDDLPFEEEYYTTSASLPFRAVGTPVVFVSSFLMRSMFDITATGPEVSPEERRAARDAKRREACMRWLAKVAAGETLKSRRSFPEVMDEEFVAAVKTAIEQGNAHGRIKVYEAAARSDDPTIIDWLAALADPSGVVRYRVIERMPKSIEVPEADLERLLADPDQAVREKAQGRWDR
ncbi:MAG: hypothetical protein NXI31_22725 [bacterium]|nr:hypothetical protein [bacterium]